MERFRIITSLGRGCQAGRREGGIIHHREGLYQTLSMHRLVQMVLRHHLDVPTRRYRARQALRLISESVLSTRVSMRTTCEQLLPHALTVLHCLEEEQGTEAWDASSASEMAALQMKLAGYLATQGRYRQAAALSGRSHRLYELYPIAMRPQWTRSLLDLADCYAQQGKDGQAQTCYERARAIQEQVLGPSHPEVIATLPGLALLHKKQQRYTRAIALLLPIVAKQQNRSIDPTFQVLLPHSLADLYTRQRDYAEAEDYFQRALALWQQTRTPVQTVTKPS